MSRRWTGRAARVGLFIVVSVAGLVVIANRVGPPLAAWLIARALPWQHAEVRIGSVDVHGLRGLTATDVRITPDPNGDVLSLDSLEAAYSIRELVRAPRRIRRVRLAGLEVEAVRGDSGWPWLEPFSGGGADGPELATQLPAIVIDRIEMDAASLVALDQVGRRVLAVHVLDAGGSIAIGGAPSVRLDGASVRVERAGLSEARIGGRVDRENGAWRVGSLELTDSTGGRIAVTGTVGPRAKDGVALDLRLSGRDFHVAQLHPALARVISPAQRVDVAAALRGTTSQPELTAAVDFPENGGLRAESRLERVGDGRALQLHIDVDTVDLAQVAGRSLEIGPAVGTIDARLAGSAADSLTGPVRVDLRSLGNHPMRLAGSAEFTNGSAELRFDAAARDLEARLRGRLSTGPRPSWNIALTGTMNVPLPDVIAAREPSWRGPWDVTARLAGDGASLDSLVATFDVELAHVEPTPRARAVTLTGHVAHRALDFEARGTLSGGTLDGAGTVRLADQQPDWILDRLSVHDVSLASWVGAWDLGRVDGAARARANPQGLSATVSIDSLRGGQLAGLTGSIDIDVRDRRTRVGGSLTRDDAEVVIEQLEMAGASPQRATITFARVDPSRVGGSLPPASLTGRLTLEPLSTERALSRLPLAPVRTAASASDGALPAWARSTNVRGRVELSESALGGEAIAGGVEWRFVDGEFSFGLDLHGADRSLTLAGTSAPFGQPVTFSIDTARLENLDLSRWIGSRMPQGRVNGTLRASVTGTDPSRARAHASLVVDSTRLGPIDVDRGSVTLSLVDGEASLEARGSRGSRRATIEGDAQYQPDRSWRGSGTAFLVDSSFSAQDDTLHLRFGFATPDSSPARRWLGTLEGEGALAGLRLDTLAATLALDDHAVTVTRLAAAGPILQLRGEGALPRGGAGGRSASLAVRGATTDLGKVLSVAGYSGYRGRAALSVRSSGPATGLRHEVKLEVANFVGRHLEVDSVGLTLIARSDSIGRLETWTADVLAIGPWLAAGSVPLLIGPGSASGHAGQAPASIELTANWDAGTPSTLGLSHFVALLDGQAWRLGDSTSVSLGGGGLAIGDLVIRSADGGAIEARGRVDRRGDQDLSIALASLPVAIRGRNATTALNRHVDLRFNLSGPADSPHLVAEGRAREPDGTSPLTVAADWTGDGLELRAEALQPGGGRFALGGNVPLVLSLAEASSGVRGRGRVDVTAEITDFDLARFQALLDPHDLRDLEGRVNGRLSISGETDAPGLDGEVAATDFGLRFQQYGTVVASDRVVVAFAGNRATFVAAEFRSPRRGTARITGGVDFPELRLGTLGLELHFDQFQVADSRAVAAVLSGDLAVRGTLDAPELRGRLELDEGTYQVAELNAPSALESIELTEADYRELEERFGVRTGPSNATGAAAWRAATVDVTAAARSNVWVRRTFEPALAVELAGEVHIAKAPGAEPRFAGSIHVVEGRSYVEEFGRRFTVAQGTVTLDGPLRSSRLDARATYEPRDGVTIILHVRGDAEGLTLELGSDPQLDRADIVSYIAVGRPRSDVQRFGQVPEDMAGLGADIAMSRITGELGDVARRSLGLDVVEVRQDGLKGLTLVAGHYPSRRLFLGFQQPVAFQGREGKGFGIDDTEVDAEYRVSEWLLANLSGSRSLARFFLGVRHAY